MFGNFFKRKKDIPKDELFEKFKEELALHGISIESEDDEGLLTIDFEKTSLKVSLDNLRKNYAVDKNPILISDFVNSLRASLEEIPSWEIAKSSIYYSLFSSDLDYSKIIHHKVSEEFNRVYIHSTPTNNTWITQSTLIDWNISKVDLEAQAAINANKLLNETPIICDDVNGKKLGYFEISDDTLKGSLLFATDLKDKVLNDFGWPIYAVIPVRDFCYLFSEENRDFFVDKLNSHVIKEYENSAYPITTEILKISDQGVEAIGKYMATKEAE